MTPSVRLGWACLFRLTLRSNGGASVLRDSIQTVPADVCRINYDDIKSEVLRAIEAAGLPLDQVKTLARKNGLELEDVGYALGRALIALPVHPAPAANGRPGRKNTTSDIADFALARRKMGMTWKDVFREWQTAFKSDKRMRTSHQIREAYRRHHGDKSKQRVQSRK